MLCGEERSGARGENDDLEETNDKTIRKIFYKYAEKNYKDLR